jgi:hypothetical protein
MSIGTFADRASRNHIKQTTKQKKVVFGERPASISAQSLKSSSLLTSHLGDSHSEIDMSKIQPELSRTQSTT